RDRKVGHVRQLQRHVSVPARVDEAGGGVDQQAQPAEGALAVQPPDEVVGKADPLERRAEDELAGVEDERPVVGDLDQLGQLLLRLLDVDERVARVVEDAEEAVDADVDARRLEERLVVGLDPDPVCLEKTPDRSVGEDNGGDSKSTPEASDRVTAWPSQERSSCGRRSPGRGRRRSWSGRPASSRTRSPSSCRSSWPKATAPR